LDAVAQVEPGQDARDVSSRSCWNGGHCRVGDTSGCSQSPKIEVGSNPSDLTPGSCKRETATTASTPRLPL
jgi:hypothetical protein